MISAYKNAYDLAEKLGMDIRPLAWAFMFEGERCFEGTRSFSTQGIDKAVLNLFKFLSRMGTQKIGFETGRDLDPLEFKDKNGLSWDRRLTVSLRWTVKTGYRSFFTVIMTTWTAGKILTLILN